jgi:hypothetical protein
MLVFRVPRLNGSVSSVLGHSGLGMVRNMTIASFSTRREALAAEIEAIRSEQPLLNVVRFLNSPGFWNSKITTYFGVRMPNAIHAELVKYAAAQRRSVSWVVNDFVEQGLRRAEQTKKRNRAL